MLRTATSEDLDALYEIETACFLDRRFRKDHVEWILDNERCLTLLEEDRGRPLGAVMLLFEGQTCRILSIAVMPQARRRGLATAMMTTTEAAARERECSVIRLEVGASNYGAIEFYRGLGYHTDGVLYGYYSWGEDAYSMTLRLTAEARAAARRPGAPRKIH